jgi:hypothetical protein
MKAATGELNLTLITILALGAVLAFFWALWPSIKDKIRGGINDNDGNDPNATGYVEIVETDLI